jgi:hypothetical protein
LLIWVSSSEMPSVVTPSNAPMLNVDCHSGARSAYGISRTDGVSPPAAAWSFHSHALPSISETRSTCEAR